MAESVVTLETLFGPDPAAADNSGAKNGDLGATSGPALQGAPAGAELSAKIAELERLVGRHREQLSGSQQEIVRLRDELDAVKAKTPEPTRDGTAGSPLTPPISLTEATKKLLLDNDESDLQAFESQLQGRGITKEEVLTLLQGERDKQQGAQQLQANRTTLQQALVQRHPQLLNDQAFIQSTATRYQEL